MSDLLMTENDRDLLHDLTEVADKNPKLAALTIMNLRGVVDDMENNKVYVAHADAVIERMRSVNVGRC